MGMQPPQAGRSVRTREAAGSSARGELWKDERLTLELYSQDRNVSQWPRTQHNYLIHEIGHMLGIHDEYAAADEEGHGMDPAQERLVRESGADQHPIDTNTTSVMSHGKDVLPAHYVTLWEALGKMTVAFLRPTDWQL
jgi:hypothetical protein